MKKLVFISLTIVCVATSAFAQNADIKVSYDAYFQRIDNGKADEKNQYVLHANVAQSKFEKLGVSNITEAISYATNYKLV